VHAQDFSAAAKMLEPLCRQGSGSPALRSAIARIYLQGGHLGAASQHFAAVAADPKADEMTKDMNRATEAAAYGHWDQAISALERILQEDPNNALVCIAAAKCGVIDSHHDVCRQLIIWQLHI
jgi:trafficking protein particle complex subunit 12